MKYWRMFVLNQIEANILSIVHKGRLNNSVEYKELFRALSEMVEYIDYSGAAFTA